MATSGFPSSHFPSKMTREDFVGKKFSVGGQVLVRATSAARRSHARARVPHAARRLHALALTRRARPAQVVAENETHTAYLTHESLKDLLENSLDATLQSGACNSKTDIVILGDLDREASDYLDSGKGAAIMKQVENDKRKTDIQLVRFSDFVRWSGLKSDIQRSASVAQFEKDSDKYVAPGKSRSRGKIFPRTLVATGGGSGSMKGLYAQASPHARRNRAALAHAHTRASLAASQFFS